MLEHDPFKHLPLSLAECGQPTIVCTKQGRKNVNIIKMFLSGVGSGGFDSQHGSHLSDYGADKARTSDQTCMTGSLNLKHLCATQSLSGSGRLNGPTDSNSPIGATSHVIRHKHVEHCAATTVPVGKPLWTRLVLAETSPDQQLVHPRQRLFR